MDVNSMMEIAFNTAYLVTIYFLVIRMYIKYKNGRAENRNVAVLFIISFLLLAAGDTGHVGFRIVAYLSGGLESAGKLIGAGALSTAVTVTFFYMLMYELLRVYTDRKRTALYWLIMALGIIRLVFMVLPGNNWAGEPPLTYSYIRNAFLTVMGIIIAVQFLQNGMRLKEPLLKKIAVCIFISYGFYLPVILFVKFIPLLGMLMIPKTCAYVAIAVIGNKNLFRKK